MFKICMNNPEFIKELADLIMSGEHIYFYSAIGCGKSTFMSNLAEEINNRLENK